MSEIYWITVLGNITNVVSALLIVSILILVICIAIQFTASDYVDTTDEDQMRNLKEDQMWNLKAVKRVMTSSLVIGLISLITFVFVPSKKDLYLIYGAGNVIDYCQGSPKVKELPDKAVETLNTWLDMVNEEEE